MSAPEPLPAEGVASPCIGVCTLDEARVCVGCQRSAEEIGAWPTMSDAQKQAVLDRIELRVLGGA